MSELDDIEVRVETLHRRSVDPMAAIAEANAIADSVVAWIDERTASAEPRDKVLRGISGAADLARQSYDAARELTERESVEWDALTLLAGYWRMRKDSAALEAAVVQERQTALDAAKVSRASEPTVGGAKRVASTAVTDVAKGGAGTVFGRGVESPTAAEVERGDRVEAVERLAMTVAKSSPSAARPPIADTWPREPASPVDGADPQQDLSLGELTRQLLDPEGTVSTSPDSLDRLRRLRPTDDSTTRKGPANVI